MNDQQTTLAEIREKINHFTKERDWQQFYDAQTITMALSVEVSELMELFTWARKSEIDEIIKQKKEAIAFELADILFTLLLFSHKYNIDLTESLHLKLAHNEEKYPVHKAHGKNKKYNEL